jgi:hypothetical protein
VHFVSKRDASRFAKAVTTKFGYQTVFSESKLFVTTNCERWQINETLNSIDTANHRVLVPSIRAVL